MSRRGSGQCVVNACKKLGAFTLEKIERTCLDQTFKHLPIGDTRTKPSTKIFQRSKLSSSLPFLDRQFHRALTHVLDRSQTVANGFLSVAGVAGPGCSKIDRKSTRLNSSHLVISYA